MGITEALKVMFKSKGYTQGDIAEKIGKKQNSVAMYLKTGEGMRVDNLMKLADVCGYDVVLVDRDGQCESLVIGNGSSAVSQPSEAHMNEMYEMFKKWYAEEQSRGEK